MTTNNNNFENTAGYVVEEEAEQEGMSFGLRDFLGILRASWLWIVLSMGVFGAAGWYYLKRTPNTYQRSATIVIKDDANSKGSDAYSVFSNLGGSPEQNNINNELAAIQSPANVLETVRQLNLDMNYSVEGRWHPEYLYGHSLPATVRMLGLGANESASMTLQLKANGVVVMSNFVRNGQPVGSMSTVSGRTGQIVGTPIGNIVVTRTKYYGSFVARYNQPITVSRTDLYSMTSIVQSRLSAVQTNQQSTLVEIDYRDLIPERADDIINTLINVYKEGWVKDKNQLIIATSKFINDRLSVIERELGGIDSDISNYKSSNLLPDVQAASQISMQQSQETKSQLLRLSTQRSMAQYVRNMLMRGVKSRQLLPSNSGIDSPGIEAQIGEYNTLLLQRNSLIANSSEKNPIVSDYDEQLAQMRKAIVESIDNLVASIDVQVRQARESESQANAQIASNPKQAKYLTSVGRQQQVKEQLYIFLLQKREENELSQAFTAYNVRVISAPFGNAYAIAPNHRNIMLIALAIGLLLPIVILYIREIGNTRIRSRKDIERLTIPFIGEIPYLGKRRWLFGRKKKDFLRVVVHEGDNNIMNEAFRVLRTKLEFMMPDHRKENVIILTSFNPGSGKTFLSANIAVSLAIKQKRVLIIDCDLRKATVSTLIGSPHMGLTHYLTGKDVDPHALIQVYKDNDSLCVMPVGIIPPNPTELLGNGRLQTLIDELRPEFDYIFLDCPPVEVVADTEIISGYADRTIFIARAGLLERSMLKELQKLYNGGKYRNMMIILNGTEKISGRNRYGYGYGYGYGYDYGYGRGKKSD